MGRQLGCVRRLDALFREWPLGQATYRFAIRARHTGTVTSVSPVSRADVEAAAAVIAPHTRRTPIIEIDGETLGLDITLVFKLEYLQVTGAFKARGAANYMATQPISPAGVVAASGGNHGAAVAYAARRFGHQAHIFVPTTSNPSKVERLTDLGAHVHQVGFTYNDAVDAAEAYLEANDATSIAAFDDPVVMAGAATVTRELDIAAAAGGGLDAVLLACGGGGLVGGAAAWLGTSVPIVACETAGTASYAAALAAGKPVTVPISGVAADHLGAKQIGAVPWAALAGVGAASAVVSDEDVLAAQARLWRLLRVVVEPGVAAPFAALMTGAWVPPAGGRIGVVLCGANVTMPLS